MVVKLLLVVVVVTIRSKEQLKVYIVQYHLQFMRILFNLVLLINYKLFIPKIFYNLFY